MDQANLWEVLRAKYFREWQATEPEKWSDIRLKLAMLDDLKAELRKLATDMADQ
jgi:hypothetical protein